MSGYAPLNQPKQIDDNIWIVDGDTIDFYGLPFTTRMTIIRLRTGELFLHSPIALTPELKASIDALGTVRHLVSPNWIHYAYIPEWKNTYTDTLAWASPKVKERAHSRHVYIHFDKDLSTVAEAEWKEEIDQHIVEGSFAHTEVIFFHRPSRTLILTDLIENFEKQNIPLWLHPFAKLAGILDPDGKAPIDMRFSFLFGKKKLRKSVQTMIDWNPKRIILSHGRWYEENAVEELKRAFRWVL